MRIPFISELFVALFFLSLFSLLFVCVRTAAHLSSPTPSMRSFLFPSARLVFFSSSFFSGRNIEDVGLRVEGKSALSTCDLSIKFRPIATVLFLHLDG